MKRGCRGSVTIYLALTFWVLTALVFTVIENVRSQAARLSLECAMDLALYSVFAEYQRELLEQYDLFFIDTGYGASPSVDNTARHLRDYMDENFDLTVEGSSMRLCDFLQMQVSQVELTGASRATDEGGEVFKRQAVAYMKERYGVSYLEDFFGQFQSVMEQTQEHELLTRDIEAEWEANRREIETLSAAPAKSDGDEDEEAEAEAVLENPADAVYAARNAGILRLVIDDPSTLSAQGADLGQYASARSLREGDGLMGRERTMAADRIWYHEYILDKCSCYTRQADKAVLKYQAEYILAGKDNDTDNLKWVVNRLLFLREAANVAYLFGDSAKVAQAKALAMTLALIARNPDLAEPLKISILFAWAYAESIYDVKQLLLGGRVPLIKDPESWHYSLGGILHFQSELPHTASNQETGGGGGTSGIDITNLSYRDYLRILLTAAPEKKTVFRMMDIIEMDIRRTPGGGSFCMDGCVDDIRARAFGGSRFDFIWQIDREYCYF